MQDNATDRIYSNGAYPTFDEAVKGSLDSGKLADFACFAEDPMRVELDRLKDLAPEFAVVGGRTVWERTGRNMAQQP